jgi:stage II sporulation protein AA (anti-sigma F factor antagonist)
MQRRDEPASKGEDARLPGLAIERYQWGDDWVVALSGELDLVAGAQLDASVDGLLADGTNALILDLSELTFIDSTGVRSVVSLCGLCEAAGHNFAILSPSAPVERVFEICGLLDELPFVDGPLE